MPGKPSEGSRASILVDIGPASRADGHNPRVDERAAPPTPTAAGMAAGACEFFFDGRIELIAGDCLNVLKTIADNSIDSIVTDPPYGLEFMGKEWDGAKGFRRSLNGADVTRESVMGRMSARAPEYRAGALFQEWCEAWAIECLRVLKPGGHMVAFGGSRTYHRLACTVEDAGFEIRDQLAWAYGTGFPKSHDVSKGIDKAAGAEREKVRVDASAVRNPKATGGGRDGMAGATRPWIEAALKCGYHEKDGAAPATDEAREWEGWGTALKPAWEPICLARKPLSEGTIAANVLRWRTGALNIDGCRIATHDKIAPVFRKGEAHGSKYGHSDDYLSNVSPLGRWPANIVHDNSPEVLAAFPDSDGQQGDVRGDEPSVPLGGNVFGDGMARLPAPKRGDGGSAARFFYSAKADADDRLGSKHPTVKPVDLMQWLCRLVTPPNGTILDPFAGTGTTGEAAWREGFRCVQIERDPVSLDDLRRRMNSAMRSKEGRKHISAKAKAIDKGHGPLFDRAPS